MQASLLPLCVCCPQSASGAQYALLVEALGARIVSSCIPEMPEAHTRTWLV